MRSDLFALLLCAALSASAQTRPAGALPRTSDGKPDFQGIWQARPGSNYDLRDHPASAGVVAAKSIVEGGDIPYQPWAAAKKRENFTSRKTADPLSKCFFPGVPRIMYMDYPFQIFQNQQNIAITFEWSSVYRLIYTNGKPPLHDVVETWMGDSRGHWEGDTLVVDVTGVNDKTWFDMAGDFHSGDLHLTERYTMLDPDSIRYEVTVQDPKVFTKNWKINTTLARQKNKSRVVEYQCEAETEEANGDFERDPRTWYPKPGQKSSIAPVAMPESSGPPALKAATNIRRTADGKPDISGYYQPGGGGANYGLEKHARDFLTPATKGVVIDPEDGTLPYQAWARQERINRELPHRGYDDPTAHCFVPGVPRAIYTPSPFQIIQAPGYVVLLFERMSWRQIPLDGRAHLPDNVRLWQGDSVGHWDGDTLVVETSNLNGKTWLNEVGDVVTHAEHVVERFTPVDVDKITYRATITDPIAYTRPWTIEIPLARQPEELLEVACHEDNGDLQNLKNVRDEYRAKQKKEK